MERVIKFRGLHSTEARIGHPSVTSWKYGDYFESKGNHYIKEGKDSFLVPKDTVGQFTGYFDQNDVEIYEGDFIEIKLKTYEVRWGAGGWLPFMDNEVGAFIYNFTALGNTTQNAELFES